MFIYFRECDNASFFTVKAPFKAKELVKQIEGRRWNASTKEWEVPIKNIQKALAVFPNAILDEVLIEKQEASFKRTMKALSLQEMQTIDPSKKNVPGLKGTLYDYQAIGKEFLKNLDLGEGAILGFDMGLGKTVSSLATFLELYQNKESEKCLIVCPASLKYSAWEKEILKWLPEEMSYIVIDGNDRKDNKITVQTEELAFAKDSSGKRIYETIEVRKHIETKLLKILTIEVFEAWKKDHDLFYKDFPNYLPKIFDPKKDDFKTIGFNFCDLGKEADSFFFDQVNQKKQYKKIKTGKIIEKQKSISGKELRTKQYQEKKVIYITNYESFLSDNDIIPTLDHSWTVILDECHRIKNTKAKTTKNLIKKCGMAGRRFLLSGTPLENNLTELYSLADLCYEGIFGTYNAFVNKYFFVDDWGVPIAPHKRLIPEIKETIAPIILRKTKKEVLKDLPDLVEQEYWVEMNETQNKLYEEIKNGILNTEEKLVYMDVLAQLTRIQQVLDSPALVSEVYGQDFPIESGKTAELLNILQDINIDENKIIIFSQYRKMTDILYDFLIENVISKDKIRYISGKTNLQKRAEYQNDFQNDPNVRLMLLTTAGNYGLDLYEASYVICFDQLFNPQKMNQVISRAHRHGAKKTVFAIHLLTKNSYEERKLKLLNTKKELFDYVIDGKEPTEVLSVEELVNLL